MGGRRVSVFDRARVRFLLGFLFIAGITVPFLEDSHAITVWSMIYGLWIVALVLLFLMSRFWSDDGDAGGDAAKAEGGHDV